MSDQREADKNTFRQIGLWSLVNSLKRESDVERAAVAKHNGIDPASLPGFGQEVPWGNNTSIVTQSATQGSLLGKITQVATLALAAGAIGLGANFLLNKETPKPEIPPPVDAVIEWEITPNVRGDSTTTSRIGTVREEQYLDVDETSGRASSTVE